MGKFRPKAFLFARVQRLFQHSCIFRQGQITSVGYFQRLPFNLLLLLKLFILLCVFHRYESCKPPKSAEKHSTSSLFDKSLFSRYHSANSQLQKKKKKSAAYIPRAEENLHTYVLYEKVI